MRRAVHDVTDGQSSSLLVFCHFAGREVDKDEVVHAGHQALDHLTVVFLATVLHGHETGDAASVEVILDLELAVVGHADGIPLLLLTSFLHDSPYFHKCKITFFFAIRYHLERILVN